MKSKKRLICSICAVFMIAFSLFLIPFSKVDNASADSVTTEYFFEGSNVYIPITPQTYSTGGGVVVNRSGDYAIFNFGFRFSFRQTSNLDFILDVNGLTSPEQYISSTTDGTFNKWSVEETFNLTSIGSGQMLIFEVNHISGNSLTFDPSLQLRCYFSSNNLSAFIPNIYKVRIYTDNIGSSNCNNRIRYYDINDNYVDFSFYVFYSSNQSSWLDYFTFDDRTYLLNDSLSDNQYFQSGYEEGYNNGYLTGEDTGYNNGYNSGFSNGENTGFSNGYEEGLNTANSYTFMSLIGSTIDAPIKAFRGLFNFELLGVNMVSLITGLFTLCVIVCIVKLVLGGK